MHTRKLLATMLLLGGSLLAHGQINLSGMKPLSTDSLQKNRIRYFSPGSGGKNKVWDFSRKLYSNESSQVGFMKDSTGVVSVIESGKTSYYNTTSDTLLLQGNESSIRKRTFVENKAIMKFPLSYSDSISNQYRCEGMYCGNHPFREVGSTSVNVDADGCIILAEDDTIYNVKRMHTIDTYSVCMDINVAALDTAKVTQVIDERYEWYLPESQYPIIENVISTTYLNMENLGTTRYAYCNLSEQESSQYITPEDDLGDDEQNNLLDEKIADPDIIHYSMNVNGGIVSIAYHLDSDAIISIIVANHMGIIHKQKSWAENAGQGYSMQIDCNGLRPGTYILYINVNGKIYSEKVSL